MHRLATLSLGNRAFIALLTVVVALLGVMSALTLRQELIPSVSLPQVQIITTAPGSSPQQVRDRVSAPIEDAVKGLENVESTSSASQGGVSTVTVELQYGTDVARTSNQVDAALSRIEDELPEQAEPQVLSGGSGDIPAMILSISSDLEPADLAQRLNSSVVPELKRVDGVSTVLVAGAPERRVTIAPDDAALAEEGLTTADVTEALDASGLTVPGGTVTDDDETLDVTIGQPLDSVEGIEDIMLLPPEDAAQSDTGQSDADQSDVGPGQADPAADAPPEPVRLGDVADVEEDVAEATSISRTNGRESLVLLVTPTSDGNVVAISGDVSAQLGDLLPGVGGAAESDVVFDQAPFIQTSITSLGQEGALGLGFAILVILVFLRAVRPTIVTAISIPLSLLFALLGMLISGYTLNMLTLAALTISIGRVVDDSIVVIENITRHLEYGKQRMRAVMDGTREVVAAITASTLATVIVFLPVAVVSGMAGELFRPFALTTAIAMMSSLFVAITIVPVLAYWFLRPSRAARGIDPDDAEETARIRAAAEAREERGALHRLYAPVLRWTQAHRLVTVLMAVVVLAGTVALAPLLKVNFLGDAGQNMASYTQTLEAGTSLEDSARAADRAEQALLKVDGVDVVQTTIGAAQFGFGGGSNEITYQITTDPDADQESLAEEMTRVLQGLDEGEIEEMTGGGPAMGGASVDIRVTGPDPQSRQEAVDALLAELDPVPSGVESVTSDLAGEVPTAVIRVDREAAAQRGLTEEAVVGLVASRMFPAPIDQVTIEGRELNVYLEQGDAPATLQELRDLEVAGGPLTDLAEVDEVLERPEILTEDAQETATISLTPAEEDTRPATEAAQAAIDAVDLPDGAQAQLGGAAEDIEESFGQLGIAMAAAVLLTYVLLVWIFKSLVQPLVLLVSIPFAATGALGLLILTRQPLGLPAMIGLLMLIGVVVTNAIVLMDLINQYRRAGMGLAEAIEQGAHKRLRPILMTAAATIFALIPMALGITGHGGFIAQPMAIVVIGGLVTSTLLTLVLVPVLYRMTEARGERRRLREIEAEQEREARREQRRAAREAAAAQDSGQGAGPTGQGPSGQGPSGPGSGLGPSERARHGRRRGGRVGGLLGMLRHRRKVGPKD